MTPTRCVGGYEIAVDLIRPDMTPRELAAAQRETLARFDAVTPFLTNDEIAAVHTYRRLARRERRHWRLPVLWLAVGVLLAALLWRLL